MIYKGIETNNDFKKKIKAISAETDISIAEVCKKLNIMPQSYQNIYKKQKLAFCDIADILDCLGYELEINFVPKN
jgi:predicted transcriptional regulator